jgi:hypothetical protein
MVGVLPFLTQTLPSRTNTKHASPGSRSGSGYCLCSESTANRALWSMTTPDSCNPDPWYKPVSDLLCVLSISCKFFSASSPPRQAPSGTSLRRGRRGILDLAPRPLPVFERGIRRLGHVARGLRVPQPPHHPHANPRRLNDPIRATDEPETNNTLDRKIIMLLL